MNYRLYSSVPELGELIASHSQETVPLGKYVSCELFFFID